MSHCSHQATLCQRLVRRVFDAQRQAKGRTQTAHNMRSMRRLGTSSGEATALSALLGRTHSHAQIAELVHGGALATSHEPDIFPNEIHHALQSMVSGCPISFLWLCNLFSSGLDSTKSPFSRHASPNILPFGVPGSSVPIWQPATPGFTPSLSFHHEVFDSCQSVGLYSMAPLAPEIFLAPSDGIDACSC